MRRPFLADSVFGQSCGTGISELFPGIHEQGLRCDGFDEMMCSHVCGWLANSSAVSGARRREYGFLSSQ